MPLASATFRLAGDEEFELHLKPGTRIRASCILGVQDVGNGLSAASTLFQAKIRKNEEV